MVLEEGCKACKKVESKAVEDRGPGCNIQCWFGRRVGGDVLGIVTCERGRVEGMYGTVKL